MKHITKIRKNIVIVIIVLVIISILYVIYDQYLTRNHYYSEQGRCVTVWKLSGGRCYVMPYKYTKWFEFPKENYFETKTFSWIDMYWLSDTTIYINNYYYQMDLNRIYHFDENYTIYDLQENKYYFQDLGETEFDTTQNRIFVKKFRLNDSIDYLRISDLVTVH